MNIKENSEKTSRSSAANDKMTTAQQLYIQKHHRHHHLVTLLRLLVLVLFLSLWEFSGRTGLIDTFFFSSPSMVVSFFIEMVTDGSFFSHTGITLLETLVSFLLITIISILLATLLWYSKTLSEIMEPYLVVLNSLPKSALAPLFIVWLGTGVNTIIVAGISVAVFGSIISLYANFRHVDREKLKLIYTLGGNRFDAFHKVVLPSSVPAILSNMKVNIGLCLVGVIIGEFLAARDGLGYLIIYSSQVFRWGGILILCDIVQFIYSINLLILQILSAVQHILPIPHFSKYPVSPQTVLPLSSQKNIRQT